ncbi:MAG: isopentenyl phosphate kinase [Anaerolineales bacterium]
MAELVFLKLGGSLITDKTRPFTARPETLASLAAQIAAARRARPGLTILLGHGSGSFGHTVAREYATRQGVNDSPRRYWQGFSRVWYQASALNRLLMEALQAAGEDALTFSPVSAVLARQGKIIGWNLSPLQRALASGMLPVIHGDVVFDEVLGGTILSTEDLFAHLAPILRPQRILLAGLERGVWADYPARTRLVEKITPANYEQIRAGVGASHGADVTGGMDSKVRQMLALTAQIPGLRAQIFSGDEPGLLARALQGEPIGTQIFSEG